MKPTTHRLNIEFTQEVNARLHELQRQTGAASITETIRRAIAFYDAVIEHQGNGGKIVFIHADKTQETLKII